jgi:hypothetical protein
MLNGLALRNGFEGAPKVRKNRFKYTGYPEFRDLTAVIHHPTNNSGNLVQRNNWVEK